VATGLAIVAQLGADTSYLLMATGLSVLGVGMGAAMTPATSAITEALPPAQQGVGSALNDLSREVGGAIGIAVIGSILAATYTSHVNVTGLSSQVAAQVKSSYAMASKMAPPIPEQANAAFVSGMLYWRRRLPRSWQRLPWSSCSARLPDRAGECGPGKPFGESQWAARSGARSCRSRSECA
jgi:MFS family permease